MSVGVTQISRWKEAGKGRGVGSRSSHGKLSVFEPCLPIFLAAYASALGLLTMKGLVGLHGSPPPASADDVVAVCRAFRVLQPMIAAHFCRPAGRPGAGCGPEASGKRPPRRTVRMPPSPAYSGHSAIRQRMVSSAMGRP
jgi:hypothetical protein